MPFTRPTLTQLDQDAQNDVLSSLALTGKLLAKAILRVLARVVARMTSGNYGYLDWISRQAVPFTAEGEYAEGWGALKGVTRETWSASTGVFVTTGSVIGAVLPAGSPLTRQDGYPYVTTAAAAVQNDLSLTAPAVAVIDPSDPQGTAGNCDAGALIQVGAAVAGINSTGAAGAGGFTGGADVEGDASFRARVLAAFAQPPQGGALADYVAWARAVAGVTRSWVTPNGMGAGTVVVYVMMDDAEAIHGGFPQGTNGVATAETRAAVATGDQLAVANAIFPLRPVTALVYVNAPSQNTCTYTVNLVGASGATKAAIQAAVADVHLQQGTPGGVLLDDNSTGGVLQLSYVEAAIAAVAGSAGFVITNVACNHGVVTLGATGNITSNTGYLPVAANIVWTP